MATSSIDIKLNLIAQQAAKDIAAVKKSLDQVETAEGDVQSAGKTMAAALSASADAIEADFLASRAAADKLGQALGPEMAAKVGQNGLDKFVADLKSAGLTEEQIEADVDDLAASIKRLDDVGRTMSGPKQGLDDVGLAADGAGTKLGGMRDNADNSRSVLANMVGNSTQDLGQLGGVAGTAGMALGQLGEYATEGNISLSGLAKVAGPMAAVTVVTLGITSALKKMAEVEAFKRKQVEDWVDAMKEGGDVIDAMVKKSKEAGKINALLYNGMEDLTGALDRQGLTAEKYFTMVDGGNESLANWFEATYTGKGNITALSEVIRSGTTDQEAWSTAMRDGGVRNSDLTDIVQGATIAIKDKTTATINDAEWNRVYGDTVDDVTAALVGGNVASKAVKGSIEKLGTAMRETRQDAYDLGAEIDVLAGNLDVEKEAIAFDEQITTAMENAKTKAGLTRSEIIDLEKAVIQAGETTGKTPFQIKSTVAMVEAGDLESVRMAVALWYVQNPISIASRLALPTMTRDGKPKASGGPVSGLFTMNEMGREIYYSPPGGSVLGANQTAQQEAQPAYVDQSTVINHWPPGISVSAITRAQINRQRRGGG